MSSRIKIIIVALIVIFVLGAGYLLYFNNTPSSTTAVSATGAPSSPAEVTFLNLASQLNSISFDTTILSDPRFTALVDIHTAILPETSGRTDPFAPI